MESLKFYDIYKGKVKDFELKNAELEFPENLKNTDGLLLSPPFVDLHTHVRLNGGEDYDSLMKAAVAGGFLIVNLQPNTKPVIDSLDILNEHIKLSKDKIVHYNYTVSLFGNVENLDEVNNQFGGRITGYSTDGIRYHSEDLENGFKDKKPYLLFDHSQLHEIPGDFYIGTNLPNSVRTYSNESIAIFRTVMTGTEFGFNKFHIQHVSTLQSIETITYLKKCAQITCEVTPHHVFFTPDMISSPNQKINPPISKYRDELIKAVRSGIIDTFATDHAPHPEKPVRYEDAPYGSSHIEVAFSVYLTIFEDIELVLKNLTVKPLKILGKSYADFNMNFPSDAVLIDTKAEYIVDGNNFYSKGKNCAFNGYKVKGKVLGVRRNGRWVYWDGEFIE